MPTLPAALKRSLIQALATWRDGHAHARKAVSAAARASRLRAAAWGWLPREVAVFECRRGRDASGLFSEFAAVLGFLDHYEQHRRHYAGLRIQFTDGLYLEPANGPNWWNYYFEPIDTGDAAGAPELVISPPFHDRCANHVERHLPRARGGALIDRHIRTTPPVRDRVDSYMRAHWAGASVIGVHYRGTDKSSDARRVPYAEVESVVRQHLGDGASAPSRIFLATDEQAFVDFMHARFPGQLLVRDMFRSRDGRPIDVVNADSNYQKGLDAVIDCLLLSRTQFLIRTASNLSLCAALFNPRVPDLLLNPER